MRARDKIYLSSIYLVNKRSRRNACGIEYNLNTIYREMNTCALRTPQSTFVTALRLFPSRRRSKSFLPLRRVNLDATPKDKHTSRAIVELILVLSMWMRSIFYTEKTCENLVTRAFNVLWRNKLVSFFFSFHSMFYIQCVPIANWLLWYLTVKNFLFSLSIVPAYSKTRGCVYSTK